MDSSKEIETQITNKSEISSDYPEDNVQTDALLEDKNFPNIPLSEMVDICQGVKKKTIREGKGDVFPNSQATSFVHYRAWVEKTKQLVYDTWEENQPLEMVIGKEKKEQKGLGKGVESMRGGEKCFLKVEYELAYGEKGNFSFPHVPPSSDLIYEVELIGIDFESKGRLRIEMFAEDRIDAAERRKKEGNEYFKNEQIQEAIQQYEMALGYINEDFMYQLFGKYREMANAVRHPVLLNLAACMLKSNACDAAIQHCNEVLTEDENNVKALFRRGKAHAQCGRTEEAKKDFLKAKKISPSDVAVIRELAEIKKAEKEALEKQKSMFKGMFKQENFLNPPPENKVTLESLPERKATLWISTLWDWLLKLLCKFLPRHLIRQKVD